MRFSQLVKGKLLYRENLIRGKVEIWGREYWAHIPNNDKLENLLVNGKSIYLFPTPDHTRKTSYAISLVDQNGVLICIDTRLSNPLLKEYIKKNYPDANYHKGNTYKNFYFDSEITKNDITTRIITRSVTSAEKGTAIYPERISKRDQNQLENLIDLQSKIFNTGLFYIIQRSDISGFKANKSIDPKYLILLKHAIDSGVRINALKCDVTLEEIHITGKVPIITNDE